MAFARLRSGTGSREIVGGVGGQGGAAAAIADVVDRVAHPINGIAADLMQDGRSLDLLSWTRAQTPSASTHRKRTM